MEPGADIGSAGSTGEPAADAAAPLDVKELLRPGAFPHAVTRLALEETHVSCIVLTGPFAYKIKKAVKLDFCDASTLERRRFLCEEEIRLNRRLAASLYVDVVAIVRGPEGASIGGPGRIIDYAVRMQQFDGAEQLDRLLARRAVDVAEFVRLADRLAHFHAAAPLAPGPDVFDHALKVRQVMLANIERLDAHHASLSLPPDWPRVTQGARELLARSSHALRERHRLGFVREGHGDLHARNIVRWQGELTPFDCLEFDPQLRHIDVMDDIAFLVMDLITHERSDLAAALMSRYLEHSGDYAGLRLLPLYALDRALVRAMVDGLAAEQQPTHLAAYLERLQARLRTAARLLDPAPPALYLMHGLSGSGKSWLSERLIPRLGAVRIRSDLERKRLAGVDPSVRAAAEVYSASWNERLYGHLLACAESTLAAGLAVIVDAAFLEASRRRPFLTLAQRLGIRIAILSCRANPAVLADRIAARTRGGADPSDADVRVLEGQLAAAQPFDAEESALVQVIDTTGPDPARTAVAALTE